MYLAPMKLLRQKWFRKFFTTLTLTQKIMLNTMFVTAKCVFLAFDAGPTIFSRPNNFERLELMPPYYSLTSNQVLVLEKYILSNLVSEGRIKSSNSQVVLVTSFN